MPSKGSLRAAAGASILSLVIAASGNGLQAGPEGQRPTSTTGGVAGPTDLRDDLLYAELIVHEGTPYAPFFDGHHVRLVLAVDDHAFDHVRAEVRTVGGSIERVEQAIGYLRVTVPFRTWPRVRALPGVVAASIDGPLATRWTDPKPEPRAREVTGIAVRETETTPPAGPASVNSPEAAAVRRTLSHDALGLSQLWERHPTFDGRGVGIAILEPSSANIAFTHPALQHARDASGRIVPKIADVVIPESSPRRVRATVSFTTRETLASLPVGVVRLPHAGTFRWGRADLPSGPLSVLWETTTGEVRIDTNQDLDYANDAVLHDARADASSSTPLTGIGRLRVTVSRDRSEVVLHLGNASHATMTSSVAAAAEPDGIAGTAPGARLVLVELGETGEGNVQFGGSPSGLIEALLAAAQHPDVDVISMSMVSLLGWPTVGTDTVAVLARRIAERYEKPIFKSAANSHALATTDQLGEAGFIVGAFVPGTVAHRYMGAPVTRDVVPFYTARGPRMDGAASPDVVGPVGEPAAAPCRPRSPLDKRVRFLSLPECYQLSGGTSSATPSIAGLAACLISGRKQQNIHTGTGALYAALRASARLLAGVSVTAQGAGVPQADVAWRLIAQSPDVAQIESRARVVHGLQSYFATEGQGPGLYEREGWRPGRSSRRSLVLRREDGPDVVRYDMSLTGDVSTFSVPRHVTTRKGVDTIVPVEIHPRQSGIHSVRVMLHDPSGRSIVPDRQLTIVAADELPRANARPSGRTYTGTLGAFASRFIAVRVRPGTDALRLRLEASEDVGISIQDPSGLTLSRRDLTAFRWSVPNTRRVVVPQPIPGTWIVSIHRGTREELAVAGGERSYTLDVAVIDPALSWSTGSSSRHLMHVDVKGAQDVAIAPYLAHTVSRADSTEATLPVVVPFTVEPGVALVQWRVATETSTGSLHVYLYDCSTGFCVRRDAAVPAAGSHQVSVERPAPGRWVIAVTAGPRTSATQKFTVDFSVAKAGPNTLTSPATPMDRRRGPRSAAHSFDVGCARSGERLSVLLRLEPRRADIPPESRQTSATTNVMVPALPAVLVPPCTEGGVTLTAVQESRSQ